VILDKFIIFPVVFLTDCKRFVYSELFLNQFSNSSTITFESNYFGRYCVTEKIEASKHKINIHPLTTYDREPNKITGGYILKWDRPNTLIPDYFLTSDGILYVNMSVMCLYYY
jgi:hypothetical protein